MNIKYIIEKTLKITLENRTFTYENINFIYNRIRENTDNLYVAEFETLRFFQTVEKEKTLISFKSNSKLTKIEVEIDLCHWISREDSMKMKVYDDLRYHLFPHLITLVRNYNYYFKIIFTIDPINF